LKLLSVGGLNPKPEIDQVELGKAEEEEQGKV